MWYQNFRYMFFYFVTKHACDRRTARQRLSDYALYKSTIDIDIDIDGQTDGRTDRRTDKITIPKTALAQLLRAVKINAQCDMHVKYPTAVRSYEIMKFMNSSHYQPEYDFKELVDTISPCIQNITNQVKSV